MTGEHRTTDGDAVRDAGLDEYVAWRARRQAGMAVPGTVIADALALLGHGTDATVTRLVAGESSASFVLEVKGERLILRVKRNGLQTLTDEQRVLRVARASGVHVPDVVAVSEVVAADTRFAFMLQRALGSVDLDRSRDDLTAGEQRRALQDFGADLARLHAVRTGATTPQQWYDLYCARLDWCVREIPDGSVPPHLVDYVVSARDDVNGNPRTFVSSPIGLTHQDLSLDHVRLDGTAYAGIIDWEYAQEADPIFDLAYVSMEISPDDVRAVIEEYGAKMLGAAAAARYRLYRAAVTAEDISRNLRLGLLKSAESSHAAYLRARPDIDAIGELLDDATRPFSTSV